MGIVHEGEVLLTTSEIAKYLDVGLSTVARLCDRGVLIRRKLQNDRRLYATLESVLAYRQSDAVKLRDLATRVRILEHRLNELLGQNADVTYKDRGLDNVIEKHHGHLF